MFHRPVVGFRLDGLQRLPLAYFAGYAHNPLDIIREGDHLYQVPAAKHWILGDRAGEVRRDSILV